MNIRLFALGFLLSVLISAQQTVDIQVEGSVPATKESTAWAYFGYDEANYTYAPNGQKLIKELVALSDTPVHIRTHFFLTTGNGGIELKWSSTNAYTVDAAGKAVYNWDVVDKILDTYVKAGAIPFVEIGFMPKALSTRPDPYATPWIPGSKNDRYYSGWTYPPSDYGRWSQLVYEWVRHSVKRYGKEAVKRWDWEVWNEPDIGYWHGTPDEYYKLYDYTVDAVKRALPDAQVGGPASTGPANVKAEAFLRQFLQHCSSGKNYATGKTGSPLQFISYHVKGRPEVVGDHVRMGLSQEMKDFAAGVRVIKTFPQFASLPIVLSEADPEGCAACSARFYPQNTYRNGTLYPAYEAEAFKTLLELQTQEHVNVKGILTWAFEFENQPYFDGFRTLATNGVDKPVLNFFRMEGMMKGGLLKVESNSAKPSSAIVQEGVKAPVVDAVATRSDHRISVLVWQYQDEDVSGPAAAVSLHVSGLPGNLKQVQLKSYRIDDAHSNSYTAWKQLGSPQSPTPDQYKQLVQAGQLQSMAAPSRASVENGTATVSFSLPLQALSLVQLSW
jgi:xylan 1,4-beta-xylosidase